VNPQKPVPKPVFLVYLVISLLFIVDLWVTWLWHDVGPYAWLQRNLGFWGQHESQIVGATLAFLFLFTVWLAPTFALRRFSDMPPMGLGSVQDFREAWNAQQQKRNAMLAQPVGASERARYFRRLGLAGIGLGGIALLLTWIVWYLNEVLWTTGLVFALVGLLGGLFTVLSGYPLIFDTSKVNVIYAVVRKIGLIVIILTMVLVAVIFALTLIGR
jgi:hypothetical protein